MASLNKFIGIGNLGRDPETRYMPNGDAVCNFSIACSEQWKDKGGARQERTEWVRCTAYRKLGEICGEFLKKGSQVYIEGRLETRKWTDKEGKERYTTEIIISEMKMLGSKRDGGSQDEPAPKQEKPSLPGNVQDMSDDAPFANPYRGRLAYVV